MNTYERIKELAKLKKLSIRQLEINFGYSNGYIGSWKKQTPSSKELARLADYFDVSVDYLLGRTDNPSPIKSELNQDDKDPLEEELLIAFRSQSNDMTSEEKEKFNESLKGMMKIARGLLDDDSNWKE
ncbi:helix-turn-helix domain-containing protein [Enterococcus sp. AZ103]|uniref:helix-turn-helix domain-containing protein n=1 Tax=Enterococcus sp. AZ103 TaxID=2774628 RepID=UPI003F257DE9